MAVVGLLSRIKMYNNNQRLDACINNIQSEDSYLSIGSCLKTLANWVGILCCIIGKKYLQMD